uniref:anoctamin-7 n=1 Tax=Oncorhynchus gorbuscha TaxID=8017 RepID=UPI001EAEC095|nr:anoctamin-7 [Oncorhynchus gorbuscha]
MAPAMEHNPVTGVKEPYFPEKARLSRILTCSMVIMIIMFCVVRIFLVKVIMYRGIVSVMMYRTGSVVLRTQAFLIAFTSRFLPRLLYQEKFDNNLNGYVNFTLAYAPPSYTRHPMCRYKAFRDNNGNYTLVYWELLAVRLGFIIAFEHVVFFFLQAIDWMVPNVSESLELKMKRERYLVKQAQADNQDALLVSQLAPASSPAQDWCLLAHCISLWSFKWYDGGCASPCSDHAIVGVLFLVVNVLDGVSRNST